VLDLDPEIVDRLGRLGIKVYYGDASRLELLHAAGCAKAKLFVLAVDDPSAASAYGAGALRRGGVTVAVSTDGRAPALAGLLREGLEAVLPEDLETWTAEAERQRAEWRAAGVPMAERRPLLLQALNRLYDEKTKNGKVAP